MITVDFKLDLLFWLNYNYKKVFVSYSGIVRQLGGKNSSYRGAIPFWLYIVPTELIAKISEISFSSVKK